MKVTIILSLVALALAEDICSRDVANESLKHSLRQFGVKQFKAEAKLTNNNFVMSQYSVYLTLAAMAESAVGKTREELFDTLQLPSEECVRFKYYKYLLESSSETNSNEFSFEMKRILAVDENLKLNQSWVEEVGSRYNLVPKELPIKMNPVLSAVKLCRISSLHFSNFHFNSNSALYESVIYKGFWAASFPGSKIKYGANFYDDFGYAKASIDYLYMKQRVHFASLPEYKMKAIALPASQDGRYKMIFALSTDDKPISHTIEHISEQVLTEIVDSLKETPMPFKIAVPILNISYIDHNLRGVLENLGIKSLWRIPADNERISNPPAVPSSFVQNVAIRLDPQGLTEYKEEQTAQSEMEPESRFILNRPFFYAFFDTLHNVYLYIGVYAGEDEFHGIH